MGNEFFDYDMLQNRGPTSDFDVWFWSLDGVMDFEFQPNKLKPSTLKSQNFSNVFDLNDI